MSLTLIPNNRATRDSKVPPITLHEDGSPVKWRMFYSENSRIADSDELPELINVLIPGYLEMDEDGRRLARMMYVHEQQSVLRVYIYANLNAEQEAELSEVERALLTEAGTANISFDDGDDVFIWSSPHPLVLIDMFYPPYNPTTVKPLSSEGDYETVSNIIWLRAATELDFLTSLSSAGFISFGKPRAEHRVPASIRRAEGIE